MVTGVLSQASQQWSTRPPDERFSSLVDLDQACRSFREHAQTAVRPYGQLHIEAMTIGESRSAEPVLVGDTGAVARFSNWGFGQLASRINAPAGYLRELPAELAASNLNHGIFRHAVDEPKAQAEMLFHSNGEGRFLRALTTEKYTRIWNEEITSRLMRLTDQQPEWQPAPAARDGARGLYASDHDLFAFLVDSDRRVMESAPGGGLGRGFFVSNSEVGAASFSITTFLYQYVCGNHMVWGTKDVKELRIRHVGNADDKAFGELRGYLTEYADASAASDEARIKRAMEMSLGKDKEEVLDRVFGLKTSLSKKQIEAGYDKSLERQDWYGAPGTVWSMTSGLTEVARDIPQTDVRVSMERSAASLMRLAF